MASKSLSFLLFGEDVSASKTFLKAGAAAEGLGAKVDGVNTKIAASSKKLSGFSTLLGVGVVAGFAYAAKAATQFQSSMLLIQTQAGASAAEVKNMSTAILGLAGKVGTAPEQLATSLYHVESVGLRAAQALDVVKIAAEGAKVGHADLEETTNALTAAVASGITGVQNMSQAMGALNTIVGAGDMKMQDLNEALGSGILTVVKGYGLSLQDVGAALATFGDNNIRGAEAATMLRMAVQAMAVPAKAGTAELKALGLTSSQLSVDMQQGGLNQAILDLKAHLDSSGVSANQVGAVLTEVFGKRAGPGLAVLIGQVERLQTKYEDLSKGAGSFSSDWNDWLKSNQGQIDLLKGKVQEFEVEFGTKLLPILNSGLQFLNNNSKAILIVGGALLGLKVTLFALRTAQEAWNTAMVIGIGLQKLLAGGAAANAAEATALSAGATAAGSAGAAAAGARLGPVGVIGGMVVYGAMTTTPHTSPGMSPTGGSGASAVSAVGSWLKNHSGPFGLLGLGGGAGGSQSSGPSGTIGADTLSSMVRIPAAEKAVASAVAATTTVLWSQDHALDNVSQAFDRVNTKTLDLQSANLSAKDSVQAFVDGLQQNGKTLDENTAKGRANQESLLSTIKAFQDLAEKQVASGQSAGEAGKKYQQNVLDLGATAVQAGVTKSAVDELIKKYGAIPGNIATQISVEANTAKARAQIAQLIKDVSQQSAVIGGFNFGGSPTGHAKGGGVADGWFKVGEAGPEIGYKYGDKVQIFSNSQSRGMPGYASGSGSPFGYVNYGGTAASGPSASQNSAAGTQLNLANTITGDLAKLMQSAAGTPAAVGAAMSKLIGNVYTAVTKGMASTSLLSLLKRENTELVKIANERVAVAAHLKDAMSKYADDKAAYSSNVTGVAGGVSSGFSLTSVSGSAVGSTGGPSTVGQIMAGLLGERNTAQGFAASLATLKKRGLAPGLLQQLGDAGPSAAPAAAMLANASAADLKQINSLYAQDTAAGVAAGHVVADAVNLPGIKADQNAVAKWKGVSAGLDRQAAKAAAMVGANVAQQFHLTVNVGVATNGAAIGKEIAKALEQYTGAGGKIKIGKAIQS